MRASLKRNCRELSPCPDSTPRKNQPESRRPTSKCLPSSQSSADVPAADKAAVKASQNDRCWLCERKADKTRRTLEICHVYPRAISKRIQFELQHKRGRLQVSNIHSTSNLIALCSVCHYALDSEEWTFLPECMSAWIEAANAEPEKEFVPMWNNQRDIQFRRWRLGVDPYSQASQDKDFNSAFTNKPLKIWTGEVGAVILSRQLFTTDVENPSPGVLEAIGEFRKLCSLWLSYNGSCSDQKCLVCKRDRNRSDGDAKNSDDQEKDQDQENKENKGDEVDEEEEEEEEEEQDGSVGDEEYDEDEVDEEEGRHEDDGKKSSLDDASVPYSYRKGYTWAGTTANEVMAIWQGLPYVRHNNGQITLTQPNQREP